MVSESEKVRNYCVDLLKTIIDTVEAVGVVEVLEVNFKIDRETVQRPHQDPPYIITELSGIECLEIRVLWMAHSAEAVKKDILTWGDKVRRGEVLKPMDTGGGDLKKEFKVFMSVPYGDMDTWKKITDIAVRVDRYYDGMGSGFGCRDIDWTKGTRAEAEALVDRLKEAFAGMNADIDVDEQEVETT